MKKKNGMHRGRFFVGVIFASWLVGSVCAQEKINLPSLTDKTDKPTEKAKNPLPVDQRIGFAVVGLGHLGLGEIIPAFAECRYAKLTALVSGESDKLKEVGAQYGIAPEHQYLYKDFSKLKNDSSVQVIYIVLPNGLHKEYTLQAAGIGKNVLCEKPMATSVADARAMIDACRRAQVKLMIAYRLQYEPYNLAMIEMTRKQELGALKSIIAENAHDIGDPKQWRLDQKLSGGGPLTDMGIYCINAARYITGEEPTRVFAELKQNPSDPRFKQVEEQMNFIMVFPNGVTMNGYTSYAAHLSQRYRLNFEKGWAELDPAFPYRGLRMRVAHYDADKGEVVEERHLEEHNQFATEMDHMALCVLKNREPRTPGEEGLRDEQVIEALYQSASKHQPVDLPEEKEPDHSRGPVLESEQ